MEIYKGVGVWIGPYCSLLGGKSTRMGQSKHRLPFAGVSLVQRLISRFERECEEILVIANDSLDGIEDHVEILPDDSRFMGSGPLAGIYTGMKHLRGDAVIVIACDMPFASEKLAKYMAELIFQGYDAAVPYTDGQAHPLFACYHRRVLPIVEEQLQNGNRRMQGLLDRISVKIVKESDLPPGIKEDFNNTLFNMNTPEDYERAVKMLADGEKT